MLFNAHLKNVRKRMGSHQRLVHIVTILERTPRYALHWYALLLFSVAVMIVSVFLAWVTFTNSTVYDDMLDTGMSEATTINREELKDTLDVYRAKKTELARLKQIPPAIVDPGE